MLFYLLLPLLAVISGKLPLTFWQALKSNLAPPYEVVKFAFLCCLHPGVHPELLALFLAYLMPLFVMAIRWKSSFGDNSPMGMALTSFMFHLVSRHLSGRSASGWPLTRRSARGKSAWAHRS